MGPRAVLDHVLESITPASAAQAAGARQRLARKMPRGSSLGAVERVAERLAAARHAPRPRVDDAIIAVCAADHGVAFPGVDLGRNNPTTVAVDHIAGGGAAVNDVARTSDAQLVVIDCGVRGLGNDRDDLLQFRLGNATADITRGAAMTPVDALTAIQTGIALVFSFADQGLDVLALGHVAAGSEPSTAAVVCALTGMSVSDVPIEDRDAVEAALRANAPNTVAPLDVLTSVGGYEHGILAGMILAASSIHVPVVLDDAGTSAAALIAARLTPHVCGYLLASHAGTSPVHRCALSAMSLTALFELGLAHGEGTGAALALPLLRAGAALLAESPPA